MTTKRWPSQNPLLAPPQHPIEQPEQPPEEEKVQINDDNNLDQVPPKKLIKYDNRVWFYDAREDPFAKGDPLWVAYDDLTSTMIS